MAALLALFRRFYLLGVRPFAARPGRATFAVLAVICGVALHIATSIINGATLDYFRETIFALAGRAPLSIIGGEAGFAEELLEQVESVPGVKSAVPMVESRTRFILADGTSQAVQVLGIDLLRESSIRAYKVGEGEDVMDDPLVFLNNEDSIIVTKAFAAEHGFKLNTRFELVSVDGRKTFTVRGLLEPEGPAKAFGGRVAIMDIDGARMTFGKEEKLDRIDIVPKDDVDVEVLARSLEETVQHRLRVERPSTQAEAYRRSIAAYQAAVTFVGLLALIVATFLIANAMTMSVAERRSDIGVMRAVGATRLTVLAIFVGQALFFGIVGSLIGIFSGKFMASHLVASMSKGLTARFSTPIQISQLEVAREHVVAAFLLGCVASVIAAARPAIAASRIPPVDALRANVADPSQNHGSSTHRIRAALGIVFLLYLGLPPQLQWSPHAAIGRFFSATAAIVGVALVAPFAARLLIQLARVFASKRPFSRIPILLLACDSLLAHRRRAASSVLSLAIGLVLVIVIATIHTSFSGTLQDILAKSLSADFFVSTNQRFLDGTALPLRDELGNELQSLVGEQAAVRALRITRVNHQGKDVTLKAWDPMDLDERLPFVVVDRNAQEAAAELFDSSIAGMFVSEDFAARNRLHRGDRVELESPSGPTSFRIAATVRELGSPNGTVYISRVAYQKQWQDRLVSAFFIFCRAKDETSLAVIRREFESKITAPRSLITTVPSDLRELHRQGMNDIFAYWHAIEWCALIVGLLGMMNTVLVNILERKRELGMLRAVGLSRGSLYGMILFETLLQGIVAAVVSALLGSFVAMTWVEHDLASALGWGVAMRVPYVALLRALAFGVLVGLIAGFVGAHRAARPTIREAIEYE